MSDSSEPSLESGDRPAYKEARGNRHGGLRAHIHWRMPEDFRRTDGRFAMPPEHRVTFPGRSGSSIKVADASASRDNATPAELLLAALSSSQMLSYLKLCSDNGIPIMEYHDRAEISLVSDHRNQLQIERVILKPRITFDCIDEEYVRASTVRFINEALSHSLLADAMNTRIEIKPQLEFRGDVSHPAAD